jgi:prepilin-type N-terminal cleavage/methylation domain-containing protein
MFSDSAINGPDCWKCTLNVEWHDCSWCPAINLRAGLTARRGAATKPLPAPALLPHPVRRQNLFKPMKKIVNQPTALRAPRSALRNSQAFTLVELLVVIAIIGILAAMLMPVLKSAKITAQKAKAKTEAADIVNAINAYDQDYGRFPITSGEQTIAGTNDFTTGLVKYPQDPNQTLVWPPGANSIYTDSNSNVVAILMDLTAYPNSAPTCNTNHVKNPKQVKYLNAKMSGYDPSTAQLNPPGGVDNNGIYRDPWGNPYIITMNTSYNEQGTSDLYYSQKNVSQTQSGSQTGYNGLFNPNSSSPDTDNFLYHGKVMVWSAGPDGKIDDASAGAAPANKGFNKDNVLSW